MIKSPERIEQLSVSRVNVPESLRLGAAAPLQEQPQRDALLMSPSVQSLAW